MYPFVLCASVFHGNFTNDWVGRGEVLFIFVPWAGRIALPVVLW